MEKLLTLRVAKSIIGKTIRWQAPAYRANYPYSGVTKIVSVDPSQRRPIKSSESQPLTHGSLDFAFKWSDNDGEDEPLCFSDGGRYITFEIID